MLKLGRYRSNKYVQPPETPIGEFKLEAAIQERVVVNVYDLDKILLKQGFLCFIKYPNKSQHICLTDWAPLLKRRIMLPTAGINLYQVDRAMGFPNTYSMDSAIH